MPDNGEIDSLRECSNITEPSTFSKLSVSGQAAELMIRAAADHARTLGLAVSIAVVDESGLLKAFARQDGASVIAGELAIDKAYTAVAMGFGLPTDELFATVDGDRPLALNLPGRGRLVLVGGGQPITADEVVIGAIGVAGGHYTHDMQIAEAAVRAFCDAHAEPV